MPRRNLLWGARETARSPGLCGRLPSRSSTAPPDCRLCAARFWEPARKPPCYRQQRPRISGGPSMEDNMLYWALVFFIIAIIAAFFGFGGIATTAASIAQILFFVFLVIFLIALVMGVAGRRRPPI